ncbi:TPA: HXXEE domain-containing protein [Streptococcus agalactiae]
MLVELKSVETDTSKWYLNHLSAFFGNQWFAVIVYLLPIFCPNIPFLTLAVMIFAFAELAMHLFFFNLSLKKWYNPGLLTTLVGLVPVSVYYLAHDWKLYSGLDWFLG